MSIGTPQTIASAVSATAGGSSQTTTTSAAISAGDLVVVATFMNATFSGGASATVSSISISDGTNTINLVKAVSQYGAGALAPFGAELWYKEGVVAVASGATITVTMSNSIGSADQIFAILGGRVTGIVTSSSIDKTASNSGSGILSLSTSTAALSQGLEIAFGVSCQSFTTDTYSGAPGFTNLTKQTSAAVALDYDSVNSTAAITYNSSWSGSGNAMEVLVATFKGIISAPPAQVSSFFDSGSAPPNYAARMPFEAERKFPVPIVNRAPGWSSFFDSGPRPPNFAVNQPFAASFAPRGAIISTTPQGWKTFFDSGPPPPSAKNQPFSAVFAPAGAVVSITPQGWKTFFDSGPAPPNYAVRMPFEAAWKFPVPSAPVPRGWTTFFDSGPPPPSAARQPFEVVKPWRPIPIGQYSKVAVLVPFWPVKS